MAYKVTQRISACRAPPGVRRSTYPENLYCIGKMAVFPAQSSFLWGSMTAPQSAKRVVPARLPMASAATIQL